MLYYSIFYLLSLYEDANRCAKSYENAYTYDHQCESLHNLALLYYSFMLSWLFCEVMFLVALLSQMDKCLSIAFLKLSEK